MSLVGFVVLDGERVEVHNPGKGVNNKKGVIVLDERLREETLDAYGRTAVMSTEGGFLRYFIDKVTRNNEVTLIVRPM